MENIENKENMEVAIPEDETIASQIEPEIKETIAPPQIEPEIKETQAEVEEEEEAEIQKLEVEPEVRETIAPPQIEPETKESQKEVEEEVQIQKTEVSEINGTEIEEEAQIENPEAEPEPEVGVTLEEIQKWWEIPCIAQFISLFCCEFSIPNIDVEILERMLLNHGVDSVSGFTIHQIVVPLLQGIYKAQRSEIQIDFYELMMRRFIRRKCLPINMDIGDDFDLHQNFVDLPVRNQVLLLHSLCYFRLDPELENCEDIFRADVDNIRSEPLGQDSKGTTYWYFSGMRLYKDEVISEEERLWDVVCRTEDDWVELSSTFERSRNANEKELYAALQEKLPHIHKLTVKKLRLDKLTRYTVSGADINSGNLMVSRTRSSRRINSIK